MSPHTQPPGMTIRSWVDLALVTANQQGIITPEQRAMLGVTTRRPLGCALFLVFGLLMLIPVSLVFLALYFSSVAQNTQLTETVLLVGVLVFIIVTIIFMIRLSRHRNRVALWRAVDIGEIEHEQGYVVERNGEYIAQIGTRQLKLSEQAPALPPPGAYTFYYLSDIDYLLSIAPLYPQNLAPAPGYTPAQLPYAPPGPTPSYAPTPAYYAAPAPAPYPPAPMHAPYAAAGYYGAAQTHPRKRGRAGVWGCLGTILAITAVSVLLTLWFTGDVLRFMPVSAVSMLPKSNFRLITHAGHKDWINATSWSPDGKQVASAGNDGTVQIWDAVTGKLIFTYKGHQHLDQTFPVGAYGVNTVAWSPDGKRIASGGMDDQIHVWSAEPVSMGKLILNQPDKRAKQISWSPDSQMLAITTENEIIVRKADNLATITTYIEPPSCFTTAVWAPKGNRIASGNCYGALRVWDAVSKQVVFSYSYSSTVDVYGIAWSPDGNRIAATAADDTVRVWEVATKRVIMRKSNVDVQSIAWSHNGQQLAFGYGSDFLGWVIVWDAGTGRQLFKFSEQPQDDPVGAIRSIAWSPDDQSIALGGKTGLVKIWQVS